MSPIKDIKIIFDINKDNKENILNKIIDMYIFSNKNDFYENFPDFIKNNNNINSKIVRLDESISHDYILAQFLEIDNYSFFKFKENDFKRLTLSNLASKINEITSDYFFDFRKTKIGKTEVCFKELKNVVYYPTYLFQTCFNDKYFKIFNKHYYKKDKNNVFLHLAHLISNDFIKIFSNSSHKKEKEEYLYSMYSYIKLSFYPEKVYIYGSEKNLKMMIKLK